MRTRGSRIGWMQGARAVVLLALAATAGCAPYATRKVVPVDCTAQNGYVFDSIQSYFSMYVFTSADMTPNAVMKATVNPIPDGALCGDTMALEAVSTGNNDWGSLFGFYTFPVKHEATMEGVSFWARAPGNTGKAFTLLLDDSNTHDPLVMCPKSIGDAGVAALVLPPPPDSGIACTLYCTPDGGANAAPPVYDSMTGAPISSGTLTSPMAANACGNQYWVVVEVSNDWRFYTIPFARFSQQRQPNLVGTPNGLFSPGTTPGTTIVTSAINNVTFRFPKESAQDLWIDRLSFYRPGVGDGGAGQ
jgi:hypothetical protein